MFEGFRSRWTTPALVRGGQSVGDLQGKVECLPRAETVGAQGFALHQLGHHVGHIALRADIVHGHDVGMIERSHRAGFLGEALPEGGVAGVLRRQGFQSHVAGQARVPGAINLPHTTGADGFLDTVGSEYSAGGEGHAQTNSNLRIVKNRTNYRGKPGY